MHRISGSIIQTLLVAGAFALTQHAAAEPPQVVTVPTTVVAKQGDATVTFGDVDAFAQRIPEKERPVFFSSPKRVESMILEILMQKQLAAEARKEGLENDPLVKQQMGLAVDEALSRARMNRFRSEIKVPDMTQLAREEYLGNKEKYTEPGSFDVRQVLIRTNTHTDAEAKALADTVETEAQAHPDQFESLVQKYSEDQSKASNQGVLHQINTNKYAPELAKAALALTKPGQISPVVKTKYGYHVMQLIERTPDKQKTFDEVRDEIVKRQRDEYIDKTVKNKTDTIRNEPLDANPDMVASLRTRYGTAPAVPTRPDANRAIIEGGR